MYDLINKAVDWMGHEILINALTYIINFLTINFFLSYNVKLMNEICLFPNMCFPKIIGVP